MATETASSRLRARSSPGSGSLELTLLVSLDVVLEVEAGIE
jgi:hypothetical protein